MSRSVQTVADRSRDLLMPKSVEILQLLGMPVVICSDSVRKLMDSVRKVAQSDASVLITGESGTGKEAIARALHHYSLRRSHPWVDVNCAALPENLIESELFGYEKGAFSGAESTKPGLFELADKGTLFLDEIGDLELKMQVKLLRVLDGVPYYRLGGRRKISVDVRIVAATNGDLEQSIASGDFRADLYHRLGQIRFEAPPLRERRDDIVPLAEFFLRQHDLQGGFSRSAQEALLSYDWPGNVREVRNVVMRASVLSEGSEITSRDLEFGTLDRTNSPAQLSTMDLSSMEKATIFHALTKTGGNQRRAAHLLGISRRTLSRKLKTYEAHPA